MGIWRSVSVAPPKARSSADVRANASAAMAAVLFGASVVAVRVAVRDVPPVSLAVLRFGQGGPLLAAILAVVAPRYLRTRWDRLLLFGLLGLVMFVLFPVRVSVMLASCGNSVQPAAEADERAGGPVDVPDAVQQPPPAAQRQGVGQVGDRLFHQRAQPCLQAVERPLLLGELVFGAAVTDRGMPVLARLGQAAEPAVQQAGDLDLVQRVVEPRQLDELLLVAAARPATVAPQQVTPDRAHRQTLSGVGVALAVVQDLLVGPPAWSLHPGRQPVHADRLAGLGHLRQQFAQLVEAGDEAAVGLAVPHGSQRAEQQVQAVADLGLGDPDRAAGAPVRQPVQDDRGDGVQADLQR